jgi:hypothetical protein
MSKLRDALKQYIEIRRNLGSKLRGVHSALRNFVTFAERENAPYITADLALRWAKEPLHVQPATWASRLQMVRRFAVWLSATDRRTEVPGLGLLPHRYRRKTPYIYSDNEINQLVQAARQLPSAIDSCGNAMQAITRSLDIAIPSVFSCVLLPGGWEKSMRWQTTGIRGRPWPTSISNAHANSTTTRANAGRVTSYAEFLPKLK